MMSDGPCYPGGTRRNTSCYQGLWPHRITFVWIRMNKTGAKIINTTASVDRSMVMTVRKERPSHREPKSGPCCCPLARAPEQNGVVDDAPLGMGG
jgi:hypothetical protein